MPDRSPLLRQYWNLRHFLWDAREWLFVKEAMRQLRHDHVVYVHPRNGGPAAAVLQRIDVEDHGLAEPHGHVEGRRCAARWRRT